MSDELLQLVGARRGHFVFESGHHGDLWLSLELLCLEPARIRPWVGRLCDRLVDYSLEAICGPLVEGALVGLLVAEELGLQFFYTERDAPDSTDELYPVRYRLPEALVEPIRGRRVGIVNDVINAGSAVRGTYLELIRHEVDVAVVACLLTLGDTPRQLADQWNIDLLAAAGAPNSIWEPAACPLCREGVPIDGRG